MDVQGFPPSLDLKKLSFFSRWYGNVSSFTEVPDPDAKIFCFGYSYDTGETSGSIAAIVVEEHEKFSLEVRSAIWRIAEIHIERNGEWLVLWRDQKDLSREALLDFVVDAKNLIGHLRDQGN
jgi:hypothetical protein